MLRLVALLLVLTTAAQAQTVTLTGLDGRAMKVSAAELTAMPRTAADLNREGGGVAHYEGVALPELLQRVGAPLGKALRGPALADVVVVQAADGYRVALALSDIDPAFHPAPIILADRRDGQPLDADEGPFRLVVAGDARGARSARKVVEIKIEPAP